MRRTLSDTLTTVLTVTNGTHHGRGSDWRDGDAERDGGGDQHGAGERELYRRQRNFHGTDTLTATTTDGGGELWARSTFGDHGRGHDAVSRKPDWDAERQREHGALAVPG